MRGTGIDMNITLTDNELQQLVEDEFVWDPTVSPASIGVSVTDGAVTLSGTVATLSSRLAALRAAKRVKGVRAIADDITVMSTAGRSDHDIAGFLEHALEWHDEVPSTVRATVRDRVVTLDGSVDWNYQRQAAQRAVQHVVGVHRVLNNVVVKASDVPREVHRRIAAALHRYADVSATAVEVTSSDGEVWLSGEVSSWDERDRAEAAAWAAPGVSKVHNNIRII
jgi:osmotically-inducible protein OsmY